MKTSQITVTEAAQAIRRNAVIAIAQKRHRDPKYVESKIAAGSRTYTALLDALVCAGIAQFEAWQAAGDMVIQQPGGLTPTVVKILTAKAVAK